MRTSFRERWGYKGESTKLNGLTNWIEMNLRPKGTIHERYDLCCKIVVEFAKNNIDYFIAKGHLHDKAKRAAKEIDSNGLFQKFTQYAKENFHQFTTP